MPLRLTGDLFVPVEFEATYQETCRQRRHRLTKPGERGVLNASAASDQRPGERKPPEG